MIFKSDNENKNDTIKLNSEILSILLYDNTTKKNIIWASNNYTIYGRKFSFNEEITAEGENIIKFRSLKSKNVKAKRSKDSAEVFTPSWVCNEQNNLVDENWFGKKNIFNVQSNKQWATVNGKVKFLDNKNWKDYICSLCLEISCGEAPYLVSRYDTVTGNSIEIKNRIGLLDRKLKIISQNINEEKEWINWSIKAIKSIYGYDLQGDNVVLARKNILYTYIEYYIDKFNEKPSEELLIEIAKIVSWNIFQMDGLKFVIPNSNVYCKIMDWNINKEIKFSSLCRNIEESEK